MVFVIVTYCKIKRFECGMCGELFMDVDEYYDHTREIHTEEPLEKNIDEWHCEVCKKSFNKKLDAQLCEETHSNNNDKQYNDYLIELEKTKLLIEGNKPNQKKLL